MSLYNFENEVSIECLQDQLIKVNSLFAKSPDFGFRKKVITNKPLKNPNND